MDKKFLKKVGYTGKAKIKGKVQTVEIYYDPVPNRNVPPTSDRIVGKTDKKDTSYKQEVSKKYTIAPAYNKGAYQVISKDDVETAGKKV